jgi:hypothetical protein
MVRKAQIFAAGVICLMAAVVFIEVRSSATEIAAHRNMPESSLWLRPTIVSATAIVLLAQVFGSVMPLALKSETRFASFYFVCDVFALAALWTLQSACRGSQLGKQSRNYLVVVSARGGLPRATSSSQVDGAGHDSNFDNLADA